MILEYKYKTIESGCPQDNSCSFLLQTHMVGSSASNALGLLLFFEE